MVNNAGIPRRAVSGKLKYAHIEAAERALGRPMPPKAVVHHANGDRSDNRPQNLVICQDTAYHMLLHKRMAARDACGHPDWLKCTYCKKWEPPHAIRISTPPSSHAFHPECRAALMRRLRAEKKHDSQMVPNA